MINTDEGRNYRDGWTSNGNSVPALTSAAASLRIMRRRKRARLTNSG